MNAYEHVNREEKARKLAEVLIVAFERADVETDWLLAELDRLFTGTWEAAACVAGVNPPSELTKQVAAAKVRQHFENPTPADPFDGLLGN